MYTISPFDFKDTALDITLNSARISHSSQKLLFSWVSVLTGREDTTLEFVTFLSTQSRYSVSWWLLRRLFAFSIRRTFTFLQTLNSLEGIVIVATIYFKILVGIFDLGETWNQEIGFYNMSLNPYRLLAS